MFNHSLRLLVIGLCLVLSSYIVPRLLLAIPHLGDRAISIGNHKYVVSYLSMLVLLISGVILVVIGLIQIVLTYNRHRLQLHDNN